ncbi:cytochrome P450 [uncultured Sphingosinicella sp.]|uniref:cytochrome P450 n=1 Tax=uncultured Sphingosinicella sp. TaxID=478748 RepID=UPI0030DD940A|tara:strand:+ start:6975 stop:8162 length:1188 start_codon:yes stop_codon:yes gene_type:complete
MTYDRTPCLEITAEALDRDPYPTFRTLQSGSSVGWVPDLSMWLVAGYRDVETILRNTDDFVTGTRDSLIFDTFGEHMLTAEGEQHERFKSRFRGAFGPARIRASMEERTDACSRLLIDRFVNDGKAEFHAAYASRLPVLSILSLFDIPFEEEAKLRLWYDGFEGALSNFAWREDVRARAQGYVGEFHALIRHHIARVRAAPDDSLLSQVVNDLSDDRLDDAEICRNASIIFFGGISTVEAVVLNCLYALCTHPDALASVRRDPALIPQAIEETLRWLSPVQSATRHVVRDFTLGESTFRAGDIVNCMLGAANQDARVFDEPTAYRLDRTNVRKHLGFALGPHFCLGSNLARLEAITAIRHILERCPDIRLSADHLAEVRGFEFRQPTALHLEWQV